MILDCVLAMAALLATGIETAYVPDDNGSGDYLIRVEPDLVRGDTPYQFTSDVPAESQPIRRVRVYVGDAWPPTVERSVAEATKRPRQVAQVAVASGRTSDSLTTALTTTESAVARPWSLLIGTMIALFLSLGANAYLAMLLAAMRQRYLRAVQDGMVRA